ncbi:MAG: hypothetical protein ABI231_02360 [Candidatus Tumulicola sp.]
MSITACSSHSATSTKDQAATSSATSDNAAASTAPMAASGPTGAPPVYPGAAPGTRPAGLGEKAPPATAKVYYTADDFAKVKAWYKSKLNGAPEIAQPGKEKTEDAFLVGQGKTGMVVMIQSLNGKTWITIASP